MSVTTSWFVGPHRVRRPVRRLPRATGATVTAAERPAVPAPPPDTSWQRRLLDDLVLFLVVLALAAAVAVMAVLV